ncbi:hypothetical protein ACI65C_000854 [Semiaphis heraclei]
MANSMEYWNESQWIEFKEKYPWIVSADGKLGCNICSSITCLGASKKERLRISNEWSNGLIEASGKDRISQLSNLRIKIKKHYESEGHQLADKINKERKEKSIQVSMQKNNRQKLNTLPTSGSRCPAHPANELLDRLYSLPNTQGESLCRRASRSPDDHLHVVKRVSGRFERRLHQ